MGGQTTVVELNTLIMVGLLGFGAGVIVTGGLVMLIVIYNNIKAVAEKVSEDDDNEGVFGMPLSALMGGGVGGRPVSMADLQAMAAKQAAAAAPTETKQASGGNYL
jgi:hypothetical protein